MEIHELSKEVLDNRGRLRKLEVHLSVELREVKGEPSLLSIRDVNSGIELATLKIAVNGGLYAYLHEQNDAIRVEDYQALATALEDVDGCKYCGDPLDRFAEDGLCPFCYEEVAVL
jgi:hypothetical protein